MSKVLNIVQFSDLSNSAFLVDTTMWLIIFCLVNLSYWSLQAPARIIERQVAFYIQRNFRIDAFKKAVKLPLKWHKDQHSGETIDKINKSTKAISKFCDESFVVTQAITKFLGALLALILLIPWIGLLVTFTCVIAIIIVAILDKELVEIYEKNNTGDHYVAVGTQDYLTNITTVTTLRLKELVSKEILKRIDKIFPSWKKMVAFIELKWFCISMLIVVTISSTLSFYCYRSVSTGSVIKAGLFFLIYDYLRRVTDSFSTFTYKYSDVVQQYTDVRAVSNILSEYEKLGIDKDEEVQISWNKLEISKVNFFYEVNKTQQLKNINITLEKGKSYALMGESGGGKSTLLSILRGIYVANSGSVKIDNQNESSISILENFTELIPQDPEIFSDTILYNITLGMEASVEEVDKAVRLSQFSFVLDRLSNGLQTNISEKGVNLSGGEKQRLALARGLFFARNSDLILLDEPTSSVDAINEREIYKNILMNFKDKCIVSSLHKAYLLPLFNQVCVMEKGRLVLQTDVDDAIKNNEYIKKLYGSQTSVPTSN